MLQNYYFLSNFKFVLHFIIHFPWNIAESVFVVSVIFMLKFFSNAIVVRPYGSMLLLFFILILILNFIFFKNLLIFILWKIILCDQQKKEDTLAQ